MNKLDQELAEAGDARYKQSQKLSYNILIAEAEALLKQEHPDEAKVQHQHSFNINSKICG